MKKRLPAFCIWFLVLLGIHPIPLAEASGEKIAVMWVGNVNKDAAPDAGDKRVAPTRMSKRVATGLLSRLRDLAPNLEVVVKPDLPDYTTAEKLFTEFQSTCNGIVFLRSAAAQWMAQAKPKIPCFVGGANNPKLLGVVNNLDAPEGNITGVTYYISVKERFRIIKEMFPKVHAVGILFQAGHPTVPIERAETTEQCRRMGWKYREAVAETAPELTQKTETIAKEVDLIVLSNCGLVMDNTKGVVEVANEAKKPVFSFAEVPVKSGAVAGLVARDEYLGALLAESVVDVLLKHKPVSRVPVKMDPNPDILINATEMETLGLSFPDSVMQRATMVR